MGDFFFADTGCGAGFRAVGVPGGSGPMYPQRKQKRHAHSGPTGGACVGMPSKRVNTLPHSKPSNSVVPTTALFGSTAGNIVSGGWNNAVQPSRPSRPSADRL